VAKTVVADYLEHVDGDLYFAQMRPDEMNCDVCKIVVGSAGKVASACTEIANPMKMVGTRVLHGDARGVQLRDISTGLDTIVNPWGNGVTAPAANGNGVFYVTTDKDGHRELRAFDLDIKRASTLLPIHGGAVYFVEGEMYLVNPVNFNIERVILTGDNPHTELVLRGDSLAK
jgi:hypothetical protein